MGSGATISGASNLNCHIIIEKDVTVSNLQFKPVLYESDSAVEFSDMRKSAVHSVKIGCNNLFSLPYHDTAASLVGISFNTAQDGTVALTGKCSLTDGYTSYHLMKGVTLPAGTYSISGCPSNGGNDTYRLLVNIMHSDQTESYFSDTGSGVTFDVHEDDIIASISIAVGYMLDLAEEIIFRPMLVKGPKVKEFHSHHQPKKLSIPSSVRKLDGYGDGINSQYYNKIVFNNENNDAKFVQVVARRAYQEGDEWLENVLTNGLETLYVLDEAIETVIEENLLDGGLVEVEAGGHVSFENTINSDIPSRITYMIRGEI
jgi:hypothetical protein